MISNKALLPCLLLSLAPVGVRSAVWDLYDGPTGVSCVRYNFEAGVPWRNIGMDWVDAAGAKQGTKAFSAVSIRKLQTGTVRFEVPRALLQAPGMIVHHTPGSGGGQVDFKSRETGAGPRLILSMSSGSVVTLPAKADATSTRVGDRCSSTLPVGSTTMLKVGHAAAIGFGAIPAGVSSAVVEMDIAKAYGAASVGLYAVSPPVLPEPAPTSGLAAKYPGDAGIERDPSVLYFEGWDNQPEEWWRRAQGLTKMQTWTQDGGRFPAHWRGVWLDANGGYKGAGLRLEFLAATAVPTVNIFRMKGREYDQLFVRYYLKFGDDFRDALACDGGKLPGFAGDTSVAGNSWTPVNGTNGWSLRGGYLLNCDRGNPIYPRVINSTYAYHADMKKEHGDHWHWTGHGELGLSALGKWHCIEQQVKVNTPGVRDGIIRTWIDGKFAWEKTNLYLRAKPPYVIPGNLGIQKLWGTLHHGGKAKFGKKATVWYDQTVIATERIGCIK